MFHTSDTLKEKKTQTLKLTRLGTLVTKVEIFFTEIQILTGLERMAELLDLMVSIPSITCSSSLLSEASGRILTLLL